MRWAIPAVVACVVVLPAFGQKVPKSTPDGKAALAKLVEEGVKAGGLKREPRPDGKGERLVVVDAAKLAVTVKGTRDLPVRVLCDELFARWNAADWVEGPGYRDLLVVLGTVTGDDRTRGFAGYVQGYEGRHNRRYEDSAAAYAAAADRFVAAAEPEWQVACLNGAGNVHRILGNGERALGCYRRGLEITQALFKGDHPDVALGLSNVGSAHAELGAMEKALDYHRRALEMRQRLFKGDHPATATSLNNVGTDHAELGALDQAIDHLTRALEMRQRLFKGDHPDVAMSLHNLGTTYLDLREAGRAVEYLTRALRMTAGLLPGDHPSVARSLNTLGAAYLALGEPGKAFEYQTRALEMRRRLFKGDHPDVARSMNNVGGSLVALGDHWRALEYLDRALKMNRRMFPGAHPDTVASLNNFAVAHRELGACGTALEYLTASLEMKRELFKGDHPEVALALNNIGTAYADLGNHEAALGYHTRAVEMLRRLFNGDHLHLAAGLNNAAEAHDALGDHQKAEEAYRRALNALRVPGRTAPEGEPGAADLRPLPETVTCLNNRGYRRRARLGASPTADELRACGRDFWLAAAVLDRLRGEVQDRDTSKLSTGAAHADLVPRRLDVLSRLHALEHKPSDLRAAFDAAEQGRARVLLESLARRQAARLADAPADLRTREETLLRTIRVADARIARLESAPAKDRPADLEAIWKAREAAETDLNAVAEKLRAAAPRYADLRYPKPCTVEEARAALDRGEVALHYVLGAEASYLVLLEKEPAKDDPDGGLAVVKLPSRADVERRLSALLDVDTLRHAGRARDAGADLYAMLLGPVAGRIKDKHLVVVPDGPLCYLPFQLLVDRDDRYLVETHRIRYAPSLTTLRLTRLWAASRGERPGRPLFAVGDPDYGPTPADGPDPADRLARSEGRTRGEAFARLVHSGREVGELAGLFGKDRCRVLVRAGATEAAVKAASAAGELAGYRYLHFACHGVLGRGPGQPPGLVLSLPGADDKEDETGGVNDGYLRADEVLNLRLNADLVVLSACRSGRGRLYAGEGVEGLARAFLYAGSRGVVSSLWSVDDAATAGLMTAMYGRLKGGEPAADALREAQLGMVRDGRPPFEWAAFVLIGE